MRLGFHYCTNEIALIFKSLSLRMNNKRTGGSNSNFKYSCKNLMFTFRFRFKFSIPKWCHIIVDNPCWRFSFEFRPTYVIQNYWHNNSFFNQGHTYHHYSKGIQQLISVLFRHNYVIFSLSTIAQKVLNKTEHFQASKLRSK